MLTSEAVSSGSSVSLNVGKVASSEGIGVGDLFLYLLNFSWLAWFVLCVTVGCFAVLCSGDGIDMVWCGAPSVSVTAL